jgi:peptidoglycan/xylan/chitin deacetylase (PgdA/CDA1 family)/folate-dependent phosphoribosylglycinamide formyltransferase PurN
VTTLSAEREQSGTARNRFRVIVFSSLAPFEPWHLMRRLEAEIAGVEVAGLLYEQRPHKSFLQRVQLWTKNLRQPSYVAYVLSRMASAMADRLRAAATVLLRFAQASRVVYQNPNQLSLNDLAAFCRQQDWPFLLTSDIHGQDSLEFVRKQRADLGIVLGTRILKPMLYEIPVHGSLNIHKRKVPDYRGGGPVGLWEMLDGQKEIGITVHRVAEKVDTGAVVCSTVIPIEPYDTCASLALKADLLGEELLLAATRQLMQGTQSEQVQVGAGKTFKSPKPHEMRKYERDLKSMRPQYRPVYGRPMWKLLLRSCLYALVVPFRNWSCRLRKKFPIVILYHHLITDRPHPMGLPTTEFLKHLRYLKGHYRLASLREATQLLAAGMVEEPTVVLTFDDGYADNFLTLRAVLRVEPVPVTLFVCTDLIKTGAPFPHDVRAGLHGFLPMTVNQLQQLHGEEFEIGSHTRTHFDCASSDPVQLESEIAGSARHLQAILGSEPLFFSFPWGTPENMSDAAVRTAAETFQWYCSAFGGENWPGSSDAHLKRKPYPLNLWELELTLQNMLEFSPSRRPLHALPPMGRQTVPATEQNAQGKVAGEP